MQKRRSMKMVRLGLAVALTLGLASGVSAQPGEFVKGVLQPLADGFPSRPITIVNTDEAGSRDGIYCRIIQESLRPHSPVEILVSDEPAPSHGNWYTVADVRKRKGGNDGYYVMQWSYSGAPTDLHIEPIEKELGVNMSDVKTVIVNESVGDVFFMRKNAPWGPTFAGWLKYGKANPGKLKYITVDVGSGNDIRASHLIQVCEIKVGKKIPMGSHEKVAATIGAGEGDFALGKPDVVQAHWEAGKVDVAMILGSRVPPPFNKNPDIVSSKAAGLPPLLGSKKGFVVGKAVPKEHIEWLFKLFRAGADAEPYQRYLKAFPAVVAENLGPAEGDALNMQVYKDSEPVIRSVGLHWEQQK
jgi:tripartite-type tricarboxylate transporter receptor subunit TctC